MMTDIKRVTQIFTLRNDDGDTVIAEHAGEDRDIYVWQQLSGDVNKSLALSLSPEMADDLGNALIALATKAKSECRHDRAMVLPRLLHRWSTRLSRALLKLSVGSGSLVRNQQSQACDGADGGSMTADKIIQYEVLEDKLSPGDWRVEWIDKDGSCYVAFFSGPEAENRARHYFRFCRPDYPATAEFNALTDAEKIESLSHCRDGAWALGVTCREQLQAIAEALATREFSCCMCDNNGGGDCQWCEAVSDFMVNDSDWKLKALGLVKL